jgi:hypothetical protein
MLHMQVGAESFNNASQTRQAAHPTHTSWLDIRQDVSTVKITHLQSESPQASQQPSSAAGL